MSTDPQALVACSDCKRTVFAGAPPAKGFLAECGRRLANLNSCTPGGCDVARPDPSPPADAEALARLEALLAKASPQPWLAKPPGDDGSVYIDVDEAGDWPVAMMMGSSAHSQDNHDAALIAGAVNTLPSLLAQLRASQAREAALREELDRFERPDARDLSTGDPITPLSDFKPQYLRGLALLFREWCRAAMWGRPASAENAARMVETAYQRILDTEASVTALERQLEEARRVIGEIEKLDVSMTGRIGVRCRAFRTFLAGGPA